MPITIFTVIVLNVYDVIKRQAQFIKPCKCDITVFLIKFKKSMTCEYCNDVKERRQYFSAEDIDFCNNIHKNVRFSCFYVKISIHTNTKQGMVYMD